MWLFIITSVSQEGFIHLILTEHSRLYTIVNISKCFMTVIGTIQLGKFSTFIKESY